MSIDIRILVTIIFILSIVIGGSNNYGIGGAISAFIWWSFAIIGYMAFWIIYLAVT